MNTELVIALTTVPSRESGETLAQAIVERRLGACVSIIPGLTSIYRWEGEIERSEELLLYIKTRKELISRLDEYIKAEHPYDVPEFIVLPVSSVASSYLAWVGAETH